VAQPSVPSRTLTFFAYAAWLEEQSEAARETIALRVVHEPEEPPKQILLLDGGRIE
jgi:hypothetical protein